jgi:hypothetical protein
VQAGLLILEVQLAILTFLVECMHLLLRQAVESGKASASAMKGDITDACNGVFIADTVDSSEEDTRQLV